MKKNLSLFILSVVCCLFSCGSNDDGQDHIDQNALENQKNILGKWVRFAEAFQYNDFSDVSDHDTLTFNTDGTYRKTYEKVNTPLTGSYSVNSTILTLGSHTYRLSFEKDTMNLLEYGYGEYNEKIKYKRIK